MLIRVQLVAKPLFLATPLHPRHSCKYLMTDGKTLMQDAHILAEHSKSLRFFHTGSGAAWHRTAPHTVWRVVRAVPYYTTVPCRTAPRKIRCERTCYTQIFHSICATCCKVASPQQMRNKSNQCIVKISVYPHGCLLANFPYFNGTGSVYVCIGKSTH